MPARTNRGDAEADLIGHAKANAAASEWATKAIELRGAGKVSDAKAAEKRAMMFLRRVMELEKRHPPIARERNTRQRCGD